MRTLTEIENILYRNKPYNLNPTIIKFRVTYPGNEQLFDFYDTAFTFWSDQDIKQGESILSVIALNKNGMLLEEKYITSKT